MLQAIANATFSERQYLPNLNDPARMHVKSFNVGAEAKSIARLASPLEHESIATNKPCNVLRKTGAMTHPLMVEAFAYSVASILPAQSSNHRQHTRFV